MSVSSTTSGGWRVEDAIRSIFDFEPTERLNPHRTTCLAWVKDGTRRCSYFDDMQKEEPRRKERIRMIDDFLARKSPEDPLNFKATVMRFIELAACHRYKHVIKMEIIADDWFKKHENDVIRVTPLPARVAPVKRESPAVVKSTEARNYHTAAVKATSKSIEMKPYIRGRDEEQLRRLIDLPLERDERWEGQVYITKSSDVPGYIKIGYTTKSLEERFEWARRDCGINFTLMYSSGVVPHAKRLENIVHNELAGTRYRFADPCPYCIETPKRHEEWFLTTVEYAQGVVEYWREELFKDMYDRESGTLSTTRRNEVRLSASPEKIRERERTLSPEPERPRTATLSPSQSAPPALPPPPRRDTLQELVATRATRSTYSKAKNVTFQAGSIEGPPSSSPTLRAIPSTSKDSTRAPPVPAQATTSIEHTHNTRSTTSAASAGQLTRAVKANSESQISEKRKETDKSNPQSRSITPASENGLSMRSLAKSLLPGKKGGAESSASANGRVKIVGTEFQIRARAVWGKEAGVKNRDGRFSDHDERGSDRVERGPGH